MSGDRSAKEEREWSATMRQRDVEEAFKEWNSNIYGLLFGDTEDTRFLKLLFREDGTWLAIAGSFDEAGAPIVAFGSGGSVMMALKMLGKSLAGNHWRADKYGDKSS